MSELIQKQRVKTSRAKDEHWVVLPREATAEVHHQAVDQQADAVLDDIDELLAEQETASTNIVLLRAAGELAVAA